MNQNNTHNHSMTARPTRHNPYRPTSQAAPAPAADIVATADFQQDRSQYSSPPQGTVHHQLWGHVGFHAYPTQAFIPPAHDDFADPRETGTVRIFLGQLPYAVTPMQVHWIAYYFAGGTVLHEVEAIVKRYPNGTRQPAGCVHATVSRTGFDAMLAGIHKRILFDDTGVWLAGTPPEEAALEAYLSTAWRQMRFKTLPHSPVVVQEATSRVAARHWSGPREQSLSPPPYGAVVSSTTSAEDGLASALGRIHTNSTLSKRCSPADGNRSERRPRPT
jgi:hypothetical protein